MDLQDEFNEIFDDDGVLAIPTMRGSANLDTEDYEGYDGFSSVLANELQEDIPSTPGRNPGAASATDIEGTDDFDFLDVPGGMDAPGMKVTEYGSYPWGPGSNTGYRPYSQQRTDMELRALGGEEEHMPAPQAPQRDSMHDEPEVINAVPVKEPVSWDQEWHGNQNQQPSNADIDPMTLYDRSSFEYDTSTQDTIGAGIFDMEEGVTWRPRDGSFANNYAYPQYIAAEDELGVQQSEMWDSTAGEWRVTQPSASGVALARKVPRLKTPFRPEVTGPRSHIEAFGRKCASCLVEEAHLYQPSQRSRFLQAALDALGPGAAQRAKRTSDWLIKMGYPAGTAFEDTVAHLVMHATVKDLVDKNKRAVSALPRLDRLAKTVKRNNGTMKAAAAKHLAPLTRDTASLRADLGALYGSPAGRAMGQTAPSDAPTPSNGAEPGLFRPRNLAIAGGLGIGAYLLFANRKKIARNLKKMVK